MATEELRAPRPEPGNLHLKPRKAATGARVTPKGAQYQAPVATNGRQTTAAGARVNPRGAERKTTRVQMPWAFAAGARVARVEVFLCCDFVMDGRM